MATDLINNKNLNSSNSLTHLISDYLSFEENEPVIIENSKYYDNNFLFNFSFESQLLQFLNIQG